MNLIGVLVYRLFNFWLPIVPALILLPTIRELRARFQTAERENRRRARLNGLSGRVIVARSEYSAT